MTAQILQKTAQTIRNIMSIKGTVQSTLKIWPFIHTHIDQNMYVGFNGTQKKIFSKMTNSKHYKKQRKRNTTLV